MFFYQEVLVVTAAQNLWGGRGTILYARFRGMQHPESHYAAGKVFPRNVEGGWEKSRTKILVGKRAHLEDAAGQACPRGLGRNGLGGGDF